MNNIKIDSSSIFEDFKLHLDIPKNSSILFSAPFGTGKTTFLDEFFTKHDGNYNFIHLYPVHYSVASNEDIFELIKFDLLFQLLFKHKDVIQSSSDLDFSKTLALQLYLIQDFKPFNFIQKLASVTSKVGKNFNDVISILKGEAETFETYFKTLNISEQQIIELYLNESENKKGSIKEFDAISNLIFSILDRLKQNDDEEVESATIMKKENVLIIDDLDRIDPDHIFRIFNVLSAHHDWETKQNKFGFDKVILVCDVENIREIYSHRYGLNVDFIGYINKFYSNGIYRFNNKEHVIRRLSDILKKITPLNDGPLKNNPIAKYDLNLASGKYFPETISFLLKAFIITDLLDLRSLINMKKLKIRDANVYDKVIRSRFRSFKDFEFLVLCEFFIQLFGSLSSFRSKMNLLAIRSSGDPNYLGFENSYEEADWGHWIIQYCIPFWNTQFKGGNPYENAVFDFFYKDSRIHYSVIKDGYQKNFEFKRITNREKSSDLPLNEFNFFHLLNDTLNKIIENDVIR